MRISDWSSDVCSSDLQLPRLVDAGSDGGEAGGGAAQGELMRGAGHRDGQLRAPAQQIEQLLVGTDGEDHDLGACWNRPELLVVAAVDREPGGRLLALLQIPLGIQHPDVELVTGVDRKSTRLNSRH